MEQAVMEDTIKVLDEQQPEYVIGIDIGNEGSSVCCLDPSTSEVIGEKRIATTKEGITEYLDEFDQPCQVVMEATTHSPWISELVEELGHEAIVSSPHAISKLFRHKKRTDETDAENLARVCAFDRALLAPIYHRSPQERMDFAIIQARDHLVKTRTKLVNFIRGKARSCGCPIAGVTAKKFSPAEEQLSPELQETLGPVFEILPQINQGIKDLEKMAAEVSEERYPVTELLRTVPGVGPLASLSYVLTIGSPDRFDSKGAVARYLGLAPKIDRSEKREKFDDFSTSHKITRQHLIEAANYHLWINPAGSQLKEAGQRLKERRGQYGTGIAQFATARKLAELLYVLWRDGQEYLPYPMAS